MNSAIAVSYVATSVLENCIHFARYQAAPEYAGPHLEQCPFDLDMLNIKKYLTVGTAVIALVAPRVRTAARALAGAKDGFHIVGNSARALSQDRVEARDIRNIRAVLQTVA